MAKMSRKAQLSEAPGQPMDPGHSSEDENIDKIRDILFGSQTRQFEKKLMVIEDKIDKEVASLRSQTKITLDTLEEFFRKELQSLSDQLTSEKSEHAESVGNLSDKVTVANKALEKKLGQLSEKVIKDQRETQAQILQQAKNLLQEMHQKNDAFQKRMDQSMEALAHEKTDRLALADLMMEAAMRLKDEFQLPETESSDTLPTRIPRRPT